MDTYDFPYFTFETDNPDTGVRVQLGGGYVFAAEPPAPDQRSFTLHYPSMIYYVGDDGFPEAVTDPKKNMQTLANFYRDHKLHVPFLWVHPVYGEMVVRFNKPLKEPEGNKGGQGSTKGFDVEFIEVP